MGHNINLHSIVQFDFPKSSNPGNLPGHMGFPPGPIPVSRLPPYINLRPSKGGIIVRLKKINFAGIFPEKGQNSKNKFWVGNRENPIDVQKRHDN